MEKAIANTEPGTVTITNGATICDGPGGVNLFRLAALAAGLALEMKGLRMHRGRSCLSIAKATTGLRTNDRAAQIRAIEALIDRQNQTITRKDERTPNRA